MISWTRQVESCFKDWIRAICVVNIYTYFKSLAKKNDNNDERRNKERHTRSRSSQLRCVKRVMQMARCRVTWSLMVYDFQVCVKLHERKYETNLSFFYLHFYSRVLIPILLRDKNVMILLNLWKLIRNKLIIFWLS